MDDLTLVIPAKQEPNSLPIVLKEIKNYRCKKIIILEKDDYETIDAIKNFDIKIVYQTGKGYGNAIREGIDKVETSFLCVFYADGSTDPRYLEDMLRVIKYEKLSLVFCSRYERGGGSLDDDFITRIGNFFFSKFGNIFFSLKISDILFTYFLAKREDLEKLKLKSDNYCLCVEIPIKSKKNNLNYKTIPCIERKRFADKKKVKPFKVGLQILIYMIKKIFN